MTKTTKKKRRGRHAISRQEVNEGTIVAIPECPVRLRIIGYLRDGRALPASQARVGDEVYFMWEHYIHEVFWGIIQKDGYVQDINSCGSQIHSVREVFKMLKFNSYVKTMRGSVSSKSGGMSSPAEKTTSGDAPKSKKLATDLPNDLQELLNMLNESTDKSEKRKIRGQLRKVDPDWNKKR